MEPTNTNSPENEPVTSAPASETKAQLTSLVAQLEAHLDEYMVKKAPFTLPAEAKELIVKVSPYLVIIFAVLAIPALLAALGMSAVLAPVAALGGHVWGFSAVISLVVAIVTLGLELMAVPGLFKRTKGAWRLVFYATIVSFVGSLLTFNFVGGIIGAIIGWYILFQVKEKYQN